MKMKLSSIGMALFCVLCGQEASAATLLVPTAQYPNIRAAVNAAVSGDTILLKDGVYTGVNNRNIFVSGKSLTIQSLGDASTCIIDGYSATTEHYGFSFDASASPTRVAGITFQNFPRNAVVADRGTTTVSNCIFDSNARGVEVNHSGTAVVTSCLFQRNWLGLYVEQGTMTVTGCTFQDNGGYAYYGLYAWEARGTVEDCQFDRNDNGLVLEACSEVNVLRCDFEEQFGSGAIATAPTDETVTFEDCTFTGNKEGGMRAIGNVRVLRSGFTRNLASGGAVVDDGVTLSECTFTANEGVYGGGVQVYDGATITLCTFNDNAAQVFGGGIYANNNTRVENCIFTHNSAELIGGGGVFGVGNLILTDCHFTGNRAGERGGGVAIYLGDWSLITRCTFDSNQATYDGGGAFASGNVIFEQCRFTGNAAPDGSGGGLFASDEFAADDWDQTQVWNSLFTGNQSVRGGGVTFSAILPFLSNCTLSRNSASESGGGVYIAGGYTPSLVNSILWGNSAPTDSEIKAEFRAALDVTYCNVQGGWPGWANLDVDPLFVDPESGDFHLLVTSPCIDAAYESLSWPSTDLDNNPRIYGPHPDMGAYEVQESPTTLVTGTITLEGIAPNATPQSITFTFIPWDDPELTIRTVLVGPDGAIRIPGLRRTTYTLSIKGAKWLATISGVHGDAGGTVNLTATLRAGDATDDNIVDLDDLAALIASFDADPTAPNWNNGIADFNCDGLVDVVDLGLLIRNFDTEGDY